MESLLVSCSLGLMGVCSMPFTFEGAAGGARGRGGKSGLVGRLAAACGCLGWLC
jgi:hypothetical protein